ncbi:hypothetical protein RclHR1_30460001 [Rhizophagus clarus]|uniref:Uncharacterized protein n=1 Tax=Rhizophagus clarus TaxID=94130 RepID=A0A2Z6RKN1_9GLOM|nr:hypothetical protein RclHR1_30460001 [Rhizophagus clarus]
MSQLIGLIHPKIKEVLQTELHKKDQIKSAIVALCLYSIIKRKPDDTSEPIEVEKYHKGDMRAIFLEEDIEEYITRTIGEIDVQIEKTLKKGSDYILEQILEISIEAYPLHRALRGFYILLLRNIVKLDGIPMPTPICSRIFDKIEEMNPDISINVWEWNEESATPKPIIASKNFRRKQVIRLLALTDITKSEEGKYRQKNYFLWIKNPSRLIYGDSAHKEKKYLCDGCTQSSTESYNASERVNNFEEFKNYGRMINAPCVIIADFEADNKKCDEAYGESMRKLAEQKANSFCYLVHWINTGDVWGPFLYRGENATQEFVQRIDQELDADDVATISCRVGDVTYTLCNELIVDPDSSIVLRNVAKHLGLKIDKKKIIDLMEVANEFSVVPTEYDDNGKELSLFILGTQWQYRAGLEALNKRGI